MCDYTSIPEYRFPSQLNERKKQRQLDLSESKKILTGHLKKPAEFHRFKSDFVLFLTTDTQKTICSSWSTMRDLYLHLKKICVSSKDISN